MDEGDTGSYTVTITNNNIAGNSVAVGTILSAALPSGVTYSAHSISSDGSNSGGSYNSATGEWDVGRVSLGETVTLVLDFTVDAGTGGSTITSTIDPASLQMAQTDANDNHGNLSVDFTVNNDSDLVTTKTLTSGNSAPMEGDVVTFQIAVANNGAAQATNVSLTDNLPAGLTATGNNGAVSQGSYNAGTGLWTIGTLDDATSASLTLEGTVDAGQVGNTITNTTTAAAGDQPDPTTTGDDLSESVTVAASPALSLAKIQSGNADEDGSSSITLGDTLTYTITATNDGNIALTNVVVSDPKTTPASETCASVAPGATCVLTGNYLVSLADADAGSVSNTASVVSDEISTAVTAGPVTTTVEGTADFTITKTVDAANISAPTTLGYTITVTNTGNVSLTNPVLTDVLTQDGQTLTLTSGPMLDSGDIDSDGQVDPGELWTYSASFAANQAQLDNGNNIINTASFAADQIGTDSATVLTKILPSPSLTLDKLFSGNADEDGSSSITLGDTLTYTITATNDGNITLNNVVVSDPKTTPASETCASVAPGATCVLTGNYQVTLADADAGSVSNTASVVSDEISTAVTAGPVTTTVEGTADFTITKTVDTPIISAPTTLGYTITVTNTGNVSLTNPVLTDVLTQDGQTLTLTSGPTLDSGDTDSDGQVDPGELWVYSASFAATQAELDNGNHIFNTASFAADQIGTDSATVLTKIFVAPSLTLDKLFSGNADEDGSSSITLGDTLSYTITATNSGNVTLNNVLVSDPQTTPNSESCTTVAAGATCVLNGTHVVTLAEADAGSVSNTASVQSDEVTTPITTPPVVTTVSQNPAMSLAKLFVSNADEDASGDVSVGDTLTYTVTATNDGDISLTNVVVTDSKIAPASETCASVAPGATCVLTGSYVVSQSDVDSGSVSNTASATSTEVPGPITTPPVVTPTQTSAPSLAIGKLLANNADEDGSGDITIGDTLTYTITATNDGNITLNNVVVSDPKTTPSSQTCASVAPGATCVLNGQYTVALADADAGAVSNTASTQSDEVTTPVSTTPVVTSVEQNPSLALAKVQVGNDDADSSGDISLGDTLTYVITATNDGDITLNNVVVSDPKTTPASETCASVAPGATCVLTGNYQVTLADADAGSVSNTASVVSDEVPTPVSTAPVVTTVSGTPDFTITKTVDTPIISAPTTLGYTITVTNTGNVSLTNPVLTDVLTQDGQTLTLTSGPTLDSGDTDSDGQVDPGELWVYSASFAATQAELDNGNHIFNTASFAADQIGTDSATVLTKILPSPSLTLDKLLSSNADEDGSGDISVGDTLTYTLTATNTGNISLNNVEVMDAKTTPSSEICLNVAPAATCVLSGSYLVSQDDVDNGNISNSGSVTSDEVPGPITTAPVVSPTQTAAPSLAIAKILSGNADEDGSSSVTLGDSLTYTITATNDGNITLNNVVVSDPKTTPNSQTCLSVAPGADCVLNGVYQVSLADADSGQLSNIASVQSDEVTTPVATAPVLTTIDGEPALSLTKNLDANADEDASGDVSVGDTLTYIITATNDGNVSLNNVIVSDNKTTPASETCTSVAPGATCVLTGSYVVSQTDVDSGSVSNSASATSVEVPGPITTPPVVTVTQTADPSLALDKLLTSNADEDASGDVSVGDTLTYTVTAINDGNITLSNVVVTDDKTTPASETCAALAPGAACILTGTYTVQQSDVDAGGVSNSASTTSDETPDPVITPPVVTPTQPSAPDLVLTKEQTANADEDSSGDISVGDTLTYTVTATNTGNVTLNNVLVSDEKTTPSSQSCASVAPGATCVLTGSYVVSQSDVDAGNVSNSASVTSDEVPGPIATPPVITETQDGAPSIALDKVMSDHNDLDGSGDVSVGDILTYTVTATNDGNITLAEVVVSDSKTDPANATCNDVAPGSACLLTGSYTVQQSDVDAGGVSNSAAVTATGVDNPPTTPPVVTPTQPGAPALSLDKSDPVNADQDSSGDISVGDTLTYTVTATNDGNITLNNVIVSDNKTTPSSETCLTVVPGAACVLTGSYTVVQSDIDSGSISNSASATAGEIVEPITTQPVITETQDGDPSIALDKVMSNHDDLDGSDDVSVGDVLTYTVTATNDGNITLNNVIVSDNKTTPASETCAVLTPGAACVLTGTYIVQQSDIDGGGVSNSASAVSDELSDPVATPPVVTATTPAVSSLALTKILADHADEDESGTVSLGDRLTYTLTATNDGNVTQNDVVISDSKTTPSSAQCSSLAPGASCTLTGEYVVTVDDANLTSVTNIGSVISKEITDPVEATLVTEVAPAGTINGVVFNDTNSDGVHQSDEKLLAGWIVELIRDSSSASQSAASASIDNNDAGVVRSSAVSKTATAAVIASTNTDAQGYYEFNNLPLGNYSVLFRNPVNRVLYGSVTAVELTGGVVSIDQDFPVDPSGVFYDAVSRQPVSGVLASMTTANGTALPPVCFVDPLQQNQLSGVDGFYRFDLVPGAAAACPVGESEYRISFDAPGTYSDLPSTVIAVQTGALNPPAGVGAFRIAPQATAPAVGQDTTYYLSFILGSGDRDVVNNHVPLDPFQTRDPLVVGKTSIKRSASVGELIPYTITVRNLENVQRSGVDVVDIIPSGFKYVPGSARSNGVADEPVQAGRELRWAGQTIAANDNVAYDLTMVVGAGVTSGDRVNTALARNGLDGSEISNRGQAVVSIVPSAIFDCAEITGKVFEDRNGNGYQDSGETGMGGVRLATVNGQLITTDANGRYHITCAAVPDARIGSNFVLKLDERTLPVASTVTSENPRSVRLTRGKITKLNFAVGQAVRMDIDLDSRAFDNKTGAFTPHVVGRLATALKSTGQKNAVLRIRYALSAGEGFDETRSRIDAAVAKALTTITGSDETLPKIELDITRSGSAKKGGDEQ